MRLRAALLAAGILAAALVTRAEGQGITNTRALAFGEVSAGVTPGTAVVSPAGVRSFTGGAMAGNPGGVTSASFTVTGIPLLTYGITLPGSVVLSSGGNTMTVDTFTTGRRYLAEFHAVAKQFQRLDPGIARTFANATFMAHAPRVKAMAHFERFA